VTGMPKSPRGASKFSEATRERAVRLVRENTEAFGGEPAAARHVAAQVGVTVGTLRRWVRETRAEAGEVMPYMDWKDRRIAQLERELAESQQTVEILKAATTFFVRACDPQSGLESSASSSTSTVTGSESHRSVGR
jgi:transposase